MSLPSQSSAHDESGHECSQKTGLDIDTGDVEDECIFLREGKVVKPSLDFVENFEQERRNLLQTEGNPILGRNGKVSFAALLDWSVEKRQEKEPREKIEKKHKRIKKEVVEQKMEVKKKSRLRSPLTPPSTEQMCIENRQSTFGKRPTRDSDDEEKSSPASLKRFQFEDY